MLMEKGKGISVGVFRVFAVLCVFAVSLGAAHADVHKCVNAKGQVEYRDVPCGASGKSTKVIKSRSRARVEEEPIYEEDSDESAPDLNEAPPAPAAPAPAVLAPPGPRSY
jgi:hypothetical protein